VVVGKLNKAKPMQLVSTVEARHEHFLGPARVERVEGNRVLLALQNQQVWATSAVGYPYQFQLNDEVLAIGQNEDWYIIGILAGHGKTSFHVPGNLQIHAPQGSIELIASKGISMRSPSIRIVASQLCLAAKRMNERFEQMKVWVKKSYDVVSNRMTTKVDQSYRLTADKIVERAKGDVKIDGNKIHLG
jgi:hypothetical protein